jgi:hypothetical protein
MKRRFNWQLSFLFITLFFIKAACVIAKEPNLQASQRSGRFPDSQMKASSDSTSHENRTWSEVDESAKRSVQDSSTKYAAEGVIETERHNRRQEELETKLVELTLALAIVEVGTLIIYFFTMLASIRAANAAKRSADATYLAITTKRPYIQPVKILFGDENSFATGISWPDPEVGVEIAVPGPVVIFKNCGNSPAIIKRIVASFEPEECEDYNTRRHGSHFRLKPGLLMNEVGSSRLFIGPEQTLPFAVTTEYTRGWTISREQFVQMHGLEWTLVAYGRIEYEDTFKTGNLYATDFCWVVQPDFDKPEMIELLWIRGPEEHNRFT